MYSKKLRKREQILIQSAKGPLKKKREFGKYFYLLALTITFFWGGKFAYEKLTFNQGIGFLEAETIFIEANKPGRILSINYAINDTVNTRTPIVTFDRFWTGVNQASQNDNYYANRRRIIDTEKEISILQEELSADNLKLIQLQKEHHEAQSLFYANVIIQSELSKIESNLSALKADISKCQIKLKAARKRLATYHNQQSSFTDASLKLNLDSEGNQLSALPVCIISEILKSKGEVVRTGEPIVKILNPESQIIRTYFIAGTENKISAGDEAIIRFQNGDEAEGIVSKIYSSTAKQPPEIRHKFGKVQRFIIAEIKPNHPLNSRVFETQVDVLIRKKWLRKIQSFI